MLISEAALPDFVDSDGYAMAAPQTGISGVRQFTGVVIELSVLGSSYSKISQTRTVLPMGAFIDIELRQHGIDVITTPMLLTS